MSHKCDNCSNVIKEEDREFCSRECYEDYMTAAVVRGFLTFPAMAVNLENYDRENSTPINNRFEIMDI